MKCKRPLSKLLNRLDKNCERIKRAQDGSQGFWAEQLESGSHH